MFRRSASFSGSTLSRLLVSLVLVLIGAPAIVFATAAPANAALTYVVDEDGANDEPGQKDLTRQGTDYANAANGTIEVEFNWDEISWSGDNTGDGCFLFSTDGDLNANYAVCVTAEGTPAVQLAGSPVIYSCGNDRPDRCTQPVGVVTPGAGSLTSCTVGQTSTDPFGAGAAAPVDTTSTCTIDLDDVGGTGTALLINTCSFPSGQPNSDPSDCVLIPRDGFLKIVKVADPDNDTDFYFTLDDNDGTADTEQLGPINGSGELLVPVVSTGGSRPNYTLAEKMPLPNGWTLTSSGCNSGETLTDLDVDPDETVTCTFNNDFDLVPAATLTKTANPTSMGEPGGPVVYTVTIDNTSPEQEPLTLTALVDTMFGGGAGFGDLLSGSNTNLSANTCDDQSTTIPWTAGGPEFSCTFTASVTGNAGLSHRDTVTATLNDDENNVISPNDDATVTLTDVLPTITVVKDVAPGTLPETGGQVTYTVTVTNTSVEDLTLSTLNDNRFGNLRDALNPNVTDNTCDTASPTLTLGGSAFSCTFKATLAGEPDTPHINIVRALAYDDEQNPAKGSDSATVTFGDVVPTMTVVKAADPIVLDEPGGTVEYDVTVTNTSSEPVTLVSLNDNKFGNLRDTLNPNVTDSSCDDNAVVTIQPDESFQCSFEGQVLGDAGFVHTNVVRAVTVDNEGSRAQGSDDATVTILDVLPVITVDKSANKSEVPETGGDVEYTVVVTNTKQAESLTLTDLIDDKFGDLLSPTNDLVANGCNDLREADGAAVITIAAGGTFTCKFTATVTGQAGATHTNEVVATAADDDGNTDTDEDTAEVRILDVAPTITVLKIADKSSVPESGGVVVYSVTVTNNSLESVTLTNLVDDRFGVIVGGPNTITSTTCALGGVIAASGGTYSCTFTATVAGAPGNHVNEVTATVVDDDQTQATAKDDETVAITNIAPVVEVSKSANPTSIGEPGGVVSFSVTVQNTSFESVTLTDLVDDKFGDLLNDAANNAITASSCTDNTVIASGATYQCSFNASVTGDAGFAHTNIVTGTVIDDDQSTDTDTGTATVTITNIPPTVVVSKSADVGSVPESGQVVTYTVSAQNTSFEAVTLTSLTDDRFGDLLDDVNNALISNSTCVDNSAIAPAATYSCTFDAVVSGEAGDNHVNVVTGVVFDNDGSSANDTGTATVTITDVPPTIELTKDADVESVPEPGAVVTFTVSILNTSFEAVTLTSLVDDMYGDLLDAENDLVSNNTCAVGVIAPAATYTCTFDALVVGDVGDDHRDVITGTVTDNDGTTAEDDDDEVVGIDDVAPVVALTKTASVDSVDAPGGLVTYTVTVENTGGESVTLTDLVDDKFGDLLDDAGNAQVSNSTCEDGALIDVGETYECSFDARVRGTDGQHVNVVTGTVVDNDGTEAEGEAEATVDIEPADILGVDEERPRPPVVVIPDAGAPTGLTGLMGLGALLVALGGWVMTRRRPVIAG